jgi:branched-chain amino acid transport system substrate-binding protein
VKKSRLTTLLITLVILVSMVVPTVAQDGDMGEVVIPAGESIKVGIALAQSGGMEVMGTDMLRGAQLGLAAKPEVLGFPVELEVGDTQCAPEGGGIVANRFSADPTLVGVLGHMCSGSNIAALDIYGPAGVAMISGSATLAPLTASGSPVFNRVVPNDAFQAPVDARFLYDWLGVTKLAAIHDGGAYGEGLAVDVAALFAELGGELVGTWAVNVGDTDFRAVLEEIAAEEPGAIFFGGYTPEGPLIRAQMVEVGMEDVIFMGADGVITPDFINTAGAEASEGVYASKAITVETEAYQKMRAAYTDEYGEDVTGPYHAYLFDAYTVLVNAVEKVGEVDDNGDLHIDRAALVDAIRTTSGHPGLTGTISCNSVGDCSTARIGMFKIEDGEWVNAYDPMDDPWGYAEFAPGEAVKFGVALAQSGGMEVMGTDMLRGTQLANEAMPEVLGFPVELEVGDTQCAPEGGGIIANRFSADPQMVGVLGHMCSGSNIAALDIYAPAGMSLISGSATLAVFTDESGPVFNRVVPSDAFQAPVDAQYLYDVLGVRKLATMHDGGAYGEGLAVDVGELFVELGGELVGTWAVNVGDTDFRAVLEEIAAEEPGAIFFGGYTPEGPLIRAQMVEVGMEDVIFMGADGVITPDFVNTAGGEASEGIYASKALTIETEAYGEMRATYNEQFGEDVTGPYHAYLYDAYMVLANAVEQAGVVTEDGTLLVGRMMLRDAIRGTNGHAGLTGTITCDFYGDCSTAEIGMFMVEDGEWVSAPWE